jgi:hypothetical protein
MLKYGEEYVDKGSAQYEEKYRHQKLKMFTRQVRASRFCPRSPGNASVRSARSKSPVYEVVSGELTTPRTAVATWKGWRADRLAVGSSPRVYDCVDGTVSSSSARQSSTLLSRSRVTVALSSPGSVVNFWLAEVGQF